MSPLVIIKGLYLDLIQIRICIQPEMLDPDTHKLNANPQPCNIRIQNPNPDPDPLIQLNPDPIMIRMSNHGFFLYNSIDVIDVLSKTSVWLLLLYTA